MPLDANPSGSPAPAASRVMLVGAGIVGRAIAADHLRCGIPVWLADLDEATLRASCDRVLRTSHGTALSATPWRAHTPLPVVCLLPPGQTDEVLDDSGDPPWLLIESISEKLPIKQAFFAEAERWFDGPVVLTSNTSTLSINQIGMQMTRPQIFCGLHFFMPVVDRPATEVIPHDGTSEQAIEACCQHSKMLQKVPVRVADRPGFVVNRILTPYLNLAQWLLCGGVDATTIREAALACGMPMSPLELTDLIGPKTAFDGGRVVWQAFPHRIDPSPLLAGMLKRKLLGVSGGEGFYRYEDNGQRKQDDLTETVAELVQRYRHDDWTVPTNDDVEVVRDLFAAVLRAEALAIVDDGVADPEQVGQLMRGGLGWSHDHADSPIQAISQHRCESLAREFPQVKSL